MLVSLNSMRRTALTMMCLAGAAVLVSACDQSKAVYPEKRRGESTPTYGDRPRETVFGPDGLQLFGGNRKQEDGAGIGVNSFLWRASLDTVAFMPLASADPFGGVIITDWYTPPETASERIKVHVFILDRSLRADGIRAAVFRQTVDSRTGQWVDAVVDPKTVVELEDAILTRARQLRISQKQ